MPNKTYNNVQLTVTFDDSLKDRTHNIASNENIAQSLGKISTWYDYLIPTGATSGQILSWSSDDAPIWIDDGNVKNAAAVNSTFYPAGRSATTTGTGTQLFDKAFKFAGVKGTTSVIGQAKLELGNNTASGTAGNKQGSIVVYGTTAYGHTIISANNEPTADRILTLPDKSGIFALTSDIPTVPTVNDATLTFKGAGTSVVTFTANSADNKSLNITAGSNVTITPTAAGNDGAGSIEIASSHPTITLSADTTSTPPQLSHGGTFTAITSVTREGNGHVTKINTATYTLPSDQNTDTLMTQTNTTTSADYRVLLSGNANDTTETTTGRKSTKLKFNPSSGGLYSFGFLWTDITGQTLDINTLTLSDGTLHSRRFIEKTDGGAGNITNIPVTGKPFLLEVDLIRWASTTDYITRQRFTNAANGAYSYVRYCTNGTWGNWTTRKYTDTNTKVTSSANHYAPATVSGQDKSASASGATAAWSIDVVKGVTLNTDGKGHVTGLSVTSGKIPANPNTTYTLGTSGNNVTLTPSSGSVQSITVPYATSANKLNTNAGSDQNPVYFSNGIPVACKQTTNASWYGVPEVRDDGVMEIGKIIDFHSANTSTADYDLRLQYTGTATGKTITLPGATGTVALLTKGSTSYWGMIDGDGGTTGWIRTTSNGLISATGVSLANGGDGSLGTSSWAFKNAYIANINGVAVGSTPKFTDANVTQAVADSSYTNYRPLLIGNSSGTSAGFTPSPTTAGTYATAGIYCQPSSGYVYASDFMTNTYPSGTGSSLSQYGLYLKSYFKCADSSQTVLQYAGYGVRTYSGKITSSDGIAMAVGCGGLTVLGSGESAHNLISLISDDQKISGNTTLNVGGTLNTTFAGNSEVAIVSSDDSIYLITNCQTIANRKPVCLDTNSYFYPGTNKTGSIGTSSYMWNSVYAATIYENGTSLASKYAAIGHAHGLLHSDLNQAATNGTTGGWSVIGIDPSVTGYVLKSIRINEHSPNWLSGNYGAGIAFGGYDTKGVISMNYHLPTITFAGGNHNSSKTEPVWYFKISGTSGSTYNLANFYDTTTSRTANTVLAAPNGSNGTASFRKLVAADLPSHTHSYLPLSGTTINNPNTSSVSFTNGMTGNILFTNTGGTDGVARGIGGIVGATDSWSVRGYQTGDNKGCLEIAVGDDGDEGIYARQYTSGQYKATFSNNAGTASGLTYRELVLMAPSTGASTFPSDVTLSGGKLYLSGGAGSYGQLNLKTASYNVMFRNDNANTYILLTAKDDPNGSWTSARPLTINNSTGVCSINGNAANVTGTVAIANGGTGATTRLGALRALTEQNVGTSAQYFLTITDSWGKGGYTSVADAKTVLGLASAAYVTQESLLRARSTVSTDGGATGWSQIGINQYNAAYPDGVTNKIYSYGAVVSMPAPNARFDLYYNHNSSTAGAVTNGLQYRTGWDNDKKGWRMLLDNENYGSYMTYTSNRSGYASSDTHILQLGYFVTDGSYDNCTILVSSAFWGNQHGSSDIINFQQSNNTDTTSTAIHVTMSRIRIGGSVGRTFYYKADNTNNRVYLYVYVTGGNSYGRWNTTVLQSSGLTTYWRPNMSENQANSDLTEIPYTGRVDYATTATASYVLGRNTAAGLTTTGVQYAVGQLTIGSADGNAKEGSNASYKLWSYPAGGTGVSSTLANIQNLRLYWSTAYYRDIFISPNNYDIYHRAVENNNAKAWRKILDSGNYTSYTLPRNIKHIHAASGTEGSAGWVKIARITVTAAYANHPMTFTIAQRGITQYRIHLLFVNNGSAAATAISEFIIARDNSWTDTNNPRAYIIKPSDGIFDLYIRKTEVYDHIFVVDFTKADGSEGDNYSVAWTNVHAADSAITGGTEADKKSYLSTSGGTVSGTLVLSKTQDASGTANNSPALIVGGAATSTHLELDANEIMAKTDGTSTAALYINDAGGNVYINNNLAARHTATPISGQVVITDGTTGGIKSSGSTIVATPSSVVNTNWGTASDRTTIVTKGWMSYWDGSYDGSASNLKYCKKGAFGTIVTKNAGDYVLSHGNLNGTIGTNSPAADVKTFFMTSSVPTGTSSIGYNTAGKEYTLIFGKGVNTNGYGAVLRFGYDSSYPEVLRIENGTWKSTNWEKISAGHADSAGKVLYNTDTNSSDTISIVTADIPANTNHMTVIFKVSGSAAGTGKVYVASTIPYIRDVYLGGVLHVSTVSDDSGSVKLSLVPFTIQLTTSSTNTSVSLIHGTPVKITGGSTPSDRSGFDIKIVKIIGGA